MVGRDRIRRILTTPEVANGVGMSGVEADKLYPALAKQTILSREKHTTMGGGLSAVQSVNYSSAFGAMEPEDKKGKKKKKHTQTVGINSAEARSWWDD